MLSRKYQGVWPVMITPYDRHGKLDLGCYRALVDWYLERGVHGIFSLCLASEMFSLERGERIALVRATVEQCRGQVPVAATGSLGDDVEAHVALSRELADLGVDAVILTMPLFCRTEAQLERYYLTMADEVDVDLGLYECPRPARQYLSPELVGRLARTGRFGPFKETSCRLETIVTKIRAAEGTPLSVMQANTAMMVDACRAGAPGLIGLIVDIVPDLAAAVWQQLAEGGEVDRLHDLLCMAEALMLFRYPLSIKVLLGLQGINVQATTRLKTPPELDEAARQLLAGGWRAFSEALGEALGTVDAGVVEKHLDKSHPHVLPQKKHGDVFLQ